MFARFCSQSSWHWFLVALFLGAFCGGCSKQSGLDPVRGKVLYKNEPLAGAMVAFHPEGGPSLDTQPVTGLTKDDGTFSLTTGQVDGAAPGKYVVTVVCMVPEKTEEKPGAIMMGMPETTDRFEGKFASRESSKINVEIKAGQSELEPIKLE
jgi:hypothetical protein